MINNPIPLGDPPERVPHRYPKSVVPPRPAWMDHVLQTTQKGVPIPIVYGTARVTTNTIERYVSQFAAGGAAYWYPAQNVSVGDFRYSNGNLYVYTQAGVTSSSGSAGQGPSGTGSSIADGTAVCSYTQFGYRHFVAIGICEGQIVGLLQAWLDKQHFSSYTLLPVDASGQWLALNSGGAGGTFVPPEADAVGHSGTWWPIRSDGLLDSYANTASLLMVMLTTSDGALPSLTLEVQGIFSTAGSVATDANPADIAIDMLTHARRGVGWPSSRVDATSTGSGAGSWRTYCTALGLSLSWAVDSQTPVIDMLRSLLQATNTDAVWSGGALKFVPLGDQSVTANSVTYTPAQSALYSLSQDDFLSEIEITRIAPGDVFNSLPVEFVSRADGYSRLTVDDPDMTDVDARGLLRGQTLALPQVIAPATAVMLSRIRAQRSLNVRNTYTFKLGWRYLLLEPGDLVTLTDSVSGLSAVPVRITALEEDVTSGQITITAEDWPANVATAAQYAPQSGDGYSPNTVSPIQGLTVLPGQIGPGTVTDAGTTRGSNVVNIWPNPTSELAPPDGADKTTPEWAARVNAGAGAYAGSWVRQFSTAQSAPVFYGPRLVGATANQSQMVVTAPAAVGDQFYVEAQVRVTASANTGDRAGVYIWFLDASNNVLAATFSVIGSGVYYITAVGTTWTKCAGYSTAPAGTVSVAFGIWADCGLGSITAQFDQMYAVRSTENNVMSRVGFGALRTANYTEGTVNGVANSPTAGAKFSLDGTTPSLKAASGEIMLDSYTFNSGTSQLFNRIKNAIQQTGSTQDFFYSGMSTSYPDASANPTFGMMHTGVYTLGNGFHVHGLQVQIYNSTGNVDALRYVELSWWVNSSGWTQISTAPWKAPIADVLHGTAPDKTSYTNALAMFYANGYTFSGNAPLSFGVRVYLWNVFGRTTNAYDWNFGSLTTNTNAAYYGANFFTSAAAGGGGGGGGACPAPRSRIQLASGVWVHAGDLHNGQLVRGFRETDGKIVPAVGTVCDLSSKWEHCYDLALADGNVVTYSKNHRFITDRGWVRIQDLRAGDTLPNLDGGSAVVARVSAVPGLSPIVAFRVEGCNTYFSDGIGSHNVKP